MANLVASIAPRKNDRMGWLTEMQPHTAAPNTETVYSTVYMYILYRQTDRQTHPIHTSAYNRTDTYCG